MATETAETDSTAIEALLDTLSQNIDGVEAALQPVLTKPLSATSGKLPLLDKAKLYVHTSYAIESLIFSYLRLSGADAKSHPVFSELGRVRSYFEKIKSAEGAGPSSRLDKGAANRFIKHALSGNDEHDRRRAETHKIQEAGAKRKVDELADRYRKQSRFESVSKRIREDETSTEHDDTDGLARPGSTSTDQEDRTAAGEGKQIQSKKKRHTSGSTVAGPSTKDGHSTSRHRKKLSHAPKDAHQAFQSLLSKNPNA